ncbi:hypothetical protein HAX54_031074, partial [Datura stramonium]|nr:hypothetical protein [Datura stramonium]
MGKRGEALLAEDDGRWMLLVRLTGAGIGENMRGEGRIGAATGSGCFWCHFWWKRHHHMMVIHRRRRRNKRWVWVWLSTEIHGREKEEEESLGVFRFRQREEGAKGRDVRERGAAA